MIRRAGLPASAVSSSRRLPVTIPPRSFVSSSGVTRPSNDRSDHQLFVDLAAGSPEAMGALYDRHAASLFRHALALARTRPDAEDLVQAVFVKLATTGAALPGVSAPASYLHRMLHTTWLDAQRRRSTGDRVVHEMDRETHAAPGNSADAIDLERALGGLPAEQREVIVLHLIEGFSFREVGRLTGVSLFTAAARYRLATRRLRKTLAPTKVQGPKGAPSDLRTRENR
jgi:RNA polymerase sigma-70 factor, ECF subfamily